MNKIIYTFIVGDDLSNNFLEIVLRSEELEGAHVSDVVDMVTRCRSQPNEGTL